MKYSSFDAKRARIDFGEDTSAPYLSFFFQLIVRPVDQFRVSYVTLHPSLVLVAGTGRIIFTVATVFLLSNSINPMGRILKRVDTLSGPD